LHVLIIIDIFKNMNEPEKKLLTEEEALEDVLIIQKSVGKTGTKEEYIAAYNSLIKTRTKEKLKESDWLKTMGFLVSTIDRIEEINDRKDELNSQTTKNKSNLTHLERELGKIRSNQDLLDKTKEILDNGGNSLSTEFDYGILLSGLLSSAGTEAEELLVDSILGKLYQKSGMDQDDKNKEISITNAEELAFLKKAIIGTIAYVDKKIESITSLLDKTSSKIEEESGNLKTDNQEVADLEIILTTAIEHLDKLEEKEDAPAYPQGSEKTGVQQTAYLKRIKWRKDKLNLIKHSERPKKGKEIGRKWAMYKFINSRYTLISAKDTWDEVNSLQIILNRTPGITFAIYSQGAATKIFDRVPLKAIIRNGRVEHINDKSRQKYEKSLSAQSEGIRTQIVELQYRHSLDA